MKIAVLSDCHDHWEHLGRALEVVREEGAERLFYLGDFCAPFSLAALAEGFAGPVDAVLGNNDGDVFLLCQVAGRYPHVSLHVPLAELTVDGRKVALHHYPEIGLRLAESQAYDAVFSGHDHRASVEQKGRTLWANPGELMGRFGRPSLGMWDTGSGAFRHVYLGEGAE